MKNSLKYLDLWQKKRDGLRIDEDPQSDWLAMQSVLDQQMPVTSGHLIKKPSGIKALKGLKLLPKLFIALSAAAMIYTAAHIILSKRHKYSVKHKDHDSSLPIKKSKVSDSLAEINSIAYRDSISNAMASNAVTKPQLSSENDSVTNGAASYPSNKNDAKLIKNAKEASKQATSLKNVKDNKPGLAAPGSNGLPSGVPPNKNAGRQAGKTNQLLYSGKNRNQSTMIVQHLNSGANGPSAGNKTAYGKSNLAGSVKSNLPLNAGAGNNQKPGDQSKINSGDHIDDKRQLSAGNGKGDNYNQVTGQGSALQTPLSKSTGTIINAKPAADLPSSNKTTQKQVLDKSKTAKAKKDKLSASKNTAPSKLDWGIMIGVNPSGSFTPKKQNANFYGSAPVDIYPGLFLNYKLNSNWALGGQVKIFSPQNINTKYTHANASKVDSNQSLQITASRKIYSVSVPLYAIYKTNGNVSFKAGPIINFPVKQINPRSILQPASLSKDTAYYKKITGILDSTVYQRKLNIGISAGASIQVKRFIFEATYLKSLSGYKVSNGLGTFKSNNGTLQFSIGFQLNQAKP